MQNDNEQTRLLNPEDVRSSLIAPGTVLSERYRLESEIGRGGMGVVYRATDLQLMREVAVKVLPDTTTSSDARERLLREARAAAALNHPHIISVHDVGEAVGRPFFVMELVRGPSLSQVRPSDLERIVDIACQICAALEHAHANKIVHRDLKPDNVLLSKSSTSDHVKLADLGLALPGYGARISRAGMLVGTAAYMAPEQALGKSVDGRADLYALGVLLYELTTSRLPFSGEDPLAIVSQHIHAPVVPPRALRPDLPSALERVILRLLSKDPTQRFASAEETATALRESLSAKVPERERDSIASVAILDALSRGRLVGRATELAELRDFWHHALSGHGHAVLLSGEPGVGKTRLAREITTQAALDGAVILTGGCYEYEATTPYLPFVEAFRRWIRETRDVEALRRYLGEAQVQIAKLVPEIETILGPFGERPLLAPQEERLLFFDGIAQVFANIARQRGLLFYADDLHWADRGTLWLLSHLLRQLRAERVLILGAYRETELDRTHPLSKALVDWNRERLVTRIALKRFDSKETSMQLDVLLGENVSGDFGQAVHRETEGNPFFVEEVLKALIEQGAVRREAGRWKRCDVGELLIPQSVKEAIGNRLNRVSQAANELLRTAAVLGKTFTFEELKVTSEAQSEDQILDALDEAAGAQLIAAGVDESFFFTHDKIREVLYEELNPIRRRRLHRQAAAGLESRGNNLCAVEKLAHHYIQAGDYENGLRYAKQAAAEAERVFALDEAIAAYSQARDCAEALGLTDEQLAQEEAMGKAYLLHGEMVPAGEHFERALALAKDPQVRARLQCQAASSLVATGDQKGIVYLQEALKVLDPETNPLETANALSIEGRFHHLAGRHQQAKDLLERASQLVEPTVQSESVSSFAAPMITQVYAYSAGANQHLGLFDEADGWARRAIDFGRKHRVLFAEAVGHEFLGEDAIHKGDYKEGLACAAREREIVGRLHSRERECWAHFVAGDCFLYLGEYRQSELELVAGLELAESIGENRVALLLKCSLSVLQAKLERLDEALQTALACVEQAELTRMIYTRFEAYRCLSEVHFVRSEFAEAEKLCLRNLELLTGSDSRVGLLWLGPLYIKILLAAAQTEEHAANELELAGKGIEAARKGEGAAAKRTRAKEHLASYETLVRRCQSPGFQREAQRLSELFIGL